MADTIFALSTPPGKSGVAVVRVSGPRAAQTLPELGVRSLPSPRRAMLAELCIRKEARRPTSLERERREQPMRESGGERGAEYEILDKALVLYFPAPHSFTGEDSVEYHIHGSRAVVKALLDALGALPSLRPAEPGEFTRRAFLNGKMDLTAAEGLADLIDAETEGQRKQALRFMQGEAEAFYRSLRADALAALALMEAAIDFSDEDIPAHVPAEAGALARGLRERIERQLAGAKAGERVRDGVRVAILGAPNAGKSSLMNLLAGRDVAIVSHMAGTTRDVIEVHLDIGGYAAVVADTAGLRETQDEVEREGVRRSLARAQAADICIVVLDATEVASDQWPVASALLSQATGHGPQATNTIILLNKTDLALPSPLPVIEGLTPIAFSAKNRTGMEALLAALAQRVARLSNAESSFVARARHRHHLAQALAHLTNLAGLPPASPELACEELRRAGVEIGKITGAIGVEEILGEIFSRFCIGK